MKEREEANPPSILQEPVVHSKDLDFIPNRMNSISMFGAENDLAGLLTSGFLVIILIERSFSSSFLYS